MGPPAPAPLVPRAAAALAVPALALAVLAAGAGPAGGDHAPSAGLAGGDVLVVNFAFAPPVILASPGDVVTWRILDQDPDFPHTVTSDDDASLLPSEGDGATFHLLTDGAEVVRWQVPAGASGVLSYYCEPHVYLQMRGLVVVT